MPTYSNIYVISAALHIITMYYIFLLSSQYLSITGECVKSPTVHKPKFIVNSQTFFYVLINPGVGLQ